MTDDVKKRTIRYAAVSGTGVLILLVFFGLSYAGTIVRQKHILHIADTVCSTASALRNHEVQITGSCTEKTHALLFRHSVTALYDEKDARIFLLPLSGRYGVYIGVFLYESSAGCIFCGLTGKGIYSDAAYCGISPATLTVYRKKIETFMAGAVP